MNISTVSTSVAVTEKGVKKMVDTPALSFDGGKTFVVITEVQKLLSSMTAAETLYNQSQGEEYLAKQAKLEAAGLNPEEMGFPVLNLDQLLLSEVKASKWSDAVEAAIKDGPQTLLAELKDWVDENSTSNYQNYLVHSFGLSMGLKAKQAKLEDVQNFLDNLDAEALFNAFQSRAKFSEAGSYQVKAKAQREGGLKVNKATV